MANHLYGIHDAGPWTKLIQVANLTAWCVHTVAVGCDPNDHSGGDFAMPGTTAIVRLNNGYGKGVGTIPKPDRDLSIAFANRCANFVAASKGIEYVVIGNEIALAWEWPTDKPIRLVDYIIQYILCYAAIKAGAPHVKIAPAAVAPWNDSTPDAADWIDQLATMLQQLSGHVDWICLHAYTRGYGLDSFHTGVRMAPPYAHRYSGWETLYEFMGAVPVNLRHLPVIITECNGNGPWPGHDCGWVQAMYQEIDRWNRTPGNQQISGACLFRWLPDDEQWRLTPGALLDFGKALQWGYAPDERQEGAAMATLRVGDTIEAQTTVNIRRAPGLQGEIMGQLVKGDQIRISAISFADNLTWYMGAGGSTGSPTGWVAEKAPNGAVLLAAPGSSTSSPAGEAAETPVLAMVRRIAPEYGLEERLAVAVVDVESGRVGLVNGLPTTRFEPHVFFQEFNRLFADHFKTGDPAWDGKYHRIADGGRWATFHGDQAAERRALRTAVEIVAQAAYNAASYGLGQIMGFNHATCGYESAEAMEAAFSSEEAQLRAMFDYMKASGALAKLQANDIEGFAAIYNGPANVAYYSTLIRNKLGA